MPAIGIAAMPKVAGMAPSTILPGRQVQFVTPVGSVLSVVNFPFLRIDSNGNEWSDQRGQFDRQDQ